MANNIQESNTFINKVFTKFKGEGAPETGDNLLFDRNLYSVGVTYYDTINDDLYLRVDNQGTTQDFQMILNGSTPETLNVTENGEYESQDGITWNKVNVNIQIPVDDLDFLDLKYDYDIDDVKMNFMLKARNDQGSFINMLYINIMRHFKLNYDPNIQYHGFVHYDNPYTDEGFVTPQIKSFVVTGTHRIPYLGIEYTYADFDENALLKINFENDVQERNFVQSLYNKLEDGIFSNKLFYVKSKSSSTYQGFKIFESNAVFDFEDETFHSSDIYTEYYSNFNVRLIEEIRLPNLKLTYAAYNSSHYSNRIDMFNGGYDNDSKLRKIVIPNLDIQRPDWHTGNLFDKPHSFKRLPLLEEVVVTNVREDLVEDIREVLNYNSAGGSSNWILRNGSLVPNS